MIKKDKALKYFHKHTEEDKKRAKKLVDMMDDAVNNALVLASYNDECSYSVDYTSPPTQKFEVRVIIRERGRE